MISIWVNLWALFVFFPMLETWAKPGSQLTLAY
jgi:hypothetical protein